MSDGLLMPGECLYYEEIKNQEQEKHYGGVYNSFYPENVKELTGGGSYALQCSLLPAGTLEVILHRRGERMSSLVRHQQVHVGELCLPLPATEWKPGDRLTLKYAAETPQEAEPNFQWSFQASAPMDKKVKLGIVICTYKNEELVQQNVERLVKSQVWQALPLELIIVNNGGEGSALAFSYERVTQYKQENTGGSGGFYRGIEEVFFKGQSEQGFTHVLLMDDDVQFHPEIIHRAYRFQQFGKQDHVIGASMLRLEEPTVLHEAGASFRSKRSLGARTVVPKGPMTPEKLSQLGETHDVHYNAWWFCCFSREAVLQAGMPLQVFIHGDDMEYGVRLRHFGYKTYCPGGLSLWHKSFEGKPSTWMRYFDFRNGLIRLLTQEGEMKNKPSIAKVQLQRAVRRGLIRNDYGGAQMVIRAYQDLAEHGGYEIQDYGAKISTLTAEYAAFTQELPETRHHAIDKGQSMPWYKIPVKWWRYSTVNLTFLSVPTQKVWVTRNARFAWYDVPMFSHIRLDLDGQSFSFVRSRQAMKEIKQNMKAALREEIGSLRQQEKSRYS